MEFFLRIICSVSLLAIAAQDFKERKVFALLFLIAGFTTALLYYKTELQSIYFQNIGFNLLILALISGILFCYTWFKMKQSLFEVFGVGDLLFLAVLAISFPLYSFIIFLVFSLIFSLVVYLIFKPKLNDKTVPLAGLQALFLVLVLCTNWMFNLVNFYQ